jgi:Ca2+-binding RTX toxin-like protein
VARQSFLVAVAAVLAACAVPAAVQAAGVGFDEGGLEYRAYPGESNRLLIGWDDFGSPYFRFQDSVPVFAADGCSNDGPSNVRCPGGREVPVVLTLGDGDDSLRLDGQYTDFTLAGGPGVDTFDLAPDPFVGPFRQGSDGFRISLDDLRNDGRPGEASDIGSDVENVRGSELADVIVGNSFDNELAGGLRQDTIDARGGDDAIDLIDASPGYRQDAKPTTRYRLDRDHAECGAGQDVVRADTVDRVARDCERVRAFAVRTRTVGEPPNEESVTDLVLDHVVLNGSNRADVLHGNLRKPNRFFPRGGDDRVFGGRRDDRIHARGFGSDVVHCGRGEDRVWVDFRDEVAGDCEIVSRG